MEKDSLVQSARQDPNPPKLQHNPPFHAPKVWTPTQWPCVFLLVGVWKKISPSRGVGSKKTSSHYPCSRGLLFKKTTIAIKCLEVMERLFFQKTNQIDSCHESIVLFPLSFMDFPKKLEDTESSGTNPFQKYPLFGGKNPPGLYRTFFGDPQPKSLKHIATNGQHTPFGKNPSQLLRKTNLYKKTSETPRSAQKKTPKKTSEKKTKNMFCAPASCNIRLVSPRLLKATTLCGSIWTTKSKSTRAPDR